MDSKKTEQKIEKDEMIPSDIYIDPYSKEELYLFNKYFVTKDGRRTYEIYNGLFPIFFPPEYLKSLDEYSNGDMYDVEGHFGESFQKNRLEYTINLLTKLGNDLTILDVGCGEGHFTHRYSELNNVKRVFGFDYSISAISKAKEKYPTLELAVADYNFLPYKKDYFSVVILNNIIEHVDYPIHLLQNTNIVTKKNGHIILSTPSRYRIDNLIRAATGKPTVTMSKSHVEEYTINQIINFLRHTEYNEINVGQTNISNTGLNLRGIIMNVILKFTNSYIKLTGSHHQIGATAFFIGKKVKDTSYQSIGINRLIAELERK